MTDLIVKSNVKDALGDNNVSADFYDALNDQVQALLDDAARRAEANDREDRAAPRPVVAVRIQLFSVSNPAEIGDCRLLFRDFYTLKGNYRCDERRYREWSGYGTVSCPRASI